MNKIGENDRFELHRTETDHTAVRLFSLTDSRTGVTITYPEPNENVDYATAVAWLGANSSRNPVSYEDCFKELRLSLDEDSGYAAKKFGNVFANYGHASVGDMAVIPFLFDNVPASLAYRLFNATSIGSGQELSTRYVKLDDFGIRSVGEILGVDTDPATEEKWVGVQKEMADAYNMMFETLRPLLETFLNGHGYETDTAKAQSTLNARTLDVVRMFLPIGLRTKQTYVDSARDWVRMAGIFNQSSDPYVKAFAEHITAMMLLDQREDASDVALHVEKFTKYSEGTDTAVRSMRSLARVALGDESDLQFRPRLLFTPFVPGKIEPVHHRSFVYASQDAFYSALLGLRPDVNPEDLAIVIANSDDTKLDEMSQAAFGGHNHHEMMHPAFDVRGVGYVYETALAYLRDINRHRSFGRHVVQFTCEDKPFAFLDAGVNENYALRESEYWHEQGAVFMARMSAIYDAINELVEDIYTDHGSNAANALLQHILPLGAQMKMILSAPIQQWAYMTSLRVGLGGDFGYRNDVWKMLEHLRSTDPGLKHMSSHITSAPDVNDPEQILGRS